MKKILSVVLALLISVSFLSACMRQGEVSPSPLPYSSQTPGLTEKPAPTAEPTQGPYAFEIDYRKCPRLLETELGSGIINLARLTIDAFLSGEDSVVLPNLESSGNISMLLYAISVMCPPFSAYTDANELKSYDVQTRTLSWKFYDGDGTREEVLVGFENCIKEQYMSILASNDTELMRAILLYHAYTEDMAYDYDAFNMTEIDGTDPVMRIRLSGYNAITGKSGICTGISEGLCFLFGQADINCCTINCFEGESGAHEWLMAEFGGKYYFCDPTWETNGGLKYFGLSADDRASWAGGYLEQNMLIFYKSIAGRYRADDSERFSALRWIESTPDEIVREGTSILIKNNGVEPITIDCK